MSVGVAAVLAGILGAIIGSFLNVVAYRLPRGESLSHPPSRCPACGTPIKPYDNVPVLGWLLAARASAAPAARRSRSRYPIVEAVTGLLCAACVLRFGADRDVWLPLVLRAAARADHADRPRPPDHPEQVLTVIGAVAAHRARARLRRATTLVEHLIAARRAPAASSSSPRSSIPRAWGWGTSSSPA